MIGPPWARVHEHIGRFDITVDQPGGMGGIQRRGHRGDERGRVRRRQRAQPPYQRPHVAARHIPHGEEQHPVRLAGLEHRDNVRMIYRCRGPGLPDETVPERLVCRQRRREDLQRYLPPEPLIQCPEHHCHPTPADLLLQPVPGNP